jgi:hypothetical protein
MNTLNMYIFNIQESSDYLTQNGPKRGAVIETVRLYRNLFTKKGANIHSVHYMLYYYFTKDVTGAKSKNISQKGKVHPITDHQGPREAVEL